MTHHEFLVQVVDHGTSTATVNVARRAATPAWRAYSIDSSDLPATDHVSVLTRAVRRYADNQGLHIADWIFTAREHLGGNQHAVTYTVRPGATLPTHP